ncbi:MAG: DUF1501 domain-containing protein [Saprospiraceae bacterium]|nr:DUF1501 domain-containing protein [Saprospiraceae bacterium]
MDKLHKEYVARSVHQNTRRHFLRVGTGGLGAIALAGLSGFTKSAGQNILANGDEFPSVVREIAPRAKRVIYLHMAGSPSQLELFDYKPALEKLDGQLCPQSLLEGKTFAFINGVPKMLGPQAKFAQHGQSGAWVSDFLPHTAKVADDICFLKAMHTDEFNHAPAQLMVHCGSPRLGRPSMGSWVTYGLGSENDNLPGFVVLVSGGFQPSAGKSIWGSGFLPTVYQGVQCRSEGDPVLYLNDPDGMTRMTRRKTIDAINALNEKTYQEVQDPEILTRIAQYEMAYKMQISVPEVMDIGAEPDYIHALYGTQPGASSFANNCLLARRLAEQGVRYIQLFHWGWDSHGAGEAEALNGGFVRRCQETDRPIAALIKDLKQRGLFDDTLIVWGGEFGRTPMMENRSGTDNPFIGRDHHTEAFTMWMAGGGIRGGISHGETDEIGYYGIRDRVHLHDLQATILHQLGINHEAFTYRFQGRDFRLTDVAGRVVDKIVV